MLVGRDTVGAVFAGGTHGCGNLLVLLKGVAESLDPCVKPLRFEAVDRVPGSAIVNGVNSLRYINLGEYRFAKMHGGVVCSSFFYGLVSGLIYFLIRSGLGGEFYLTASFFVLNNLEHRVKSVDGGGGLFINQHQKRTDGNVVEGFLKYTGLKSDIVQVLLPLLFELAVLFEECTAAGFIPPGFGFYFDEMDLVVGLDQNINQNIRVLVAHCSLEKGDIFLLKLRSCFVKGFFFVAPGLYFNAFGVIQFGELPYLNAAFSQNFQKLIVGLTGGVRLLVGGIVEPCRAFECMNKAGFC